MVCGVRFSADMIARSGLRSGNANISTVAPYAQVNVGASPREFLLPDDPKPMTLRFDVVKIIGQMKRAAALARDDSTQLKLDKLVVYCRRPRPLRLFAEMLSLPKAISARPQRTDGRARLSISLDEAVAPCSFQCAAHSSRLFH
jgi:hypothetical protein